MFANMRWDLWELFGLLGECFFFARMIAQWLASEKAKKPVMPVIYWYMSIGGAAILIVYALHLGSFAVLLPQIVGMVFYARGIQLEKLASTREARHRELGLHRADYPWPTLTVVVPTKNEEAKLADTLAHLVKQEYPGFQPEIIAALNGCTDGSREVAARFPVRVVESERSGISFGKNLGGRAATGDMIIFVDADTRLPDGALRLIAEAAAGLERYAGTVAGAPDRGGGVVRVCFWLANLATRRKRAHAPGGVVFMDRATFAAIDGFDEKLPQGTSTDGIWRALAAGAAYVYVDAFKAVTSIRRFERTGIVGQMLSWRKKHQAIAAGRREEVERSVYEDYR